MASGTRSQKRITFTDPTVARPWKRGGIGGDDGAEKRALTLDQQTKEDKKQEMHAVGDACWDLSVGYSALLTGRESDLRLVLGQAYKNHRMVHMFCLKMMFEMSSEELSDAEREEYRQIVEETLKNFDKEIAEWNGDDVSQVQAAPAKEDQMIERKHSAEMAVFKKEKANEERAAYRGVANFFKSG
jgi:hypothetical protein